ncbi:hypothetical protein KKJ06_07785 [Xenorhabdus bovienii]|uniref:hypothetical protein n=1 Tax=Xenorhabdus bovienii TaxID=40576 RepID=UPI0023B35103|nr:hypothetical protein [Xenorhabdus bovienii]MDE9447993.1 hypothetical protein [Xenorhabdus bovienii]MDE9555339.1 hypothetical protein [Xenorhabdus bovienii]
MFGALLTAPDGTPWLLPQSTPMCLKEIVTDYRQITKVPDSVNRMIFTQRDLDNDKYKYYVFTDEPQTPPIGKWAVCFWDENGKCIVHSLSKTLSVMGSMEDISSMSWYWQTRDYKETIKGSAAVLSTVAGYGFFLVHSYGSDGSSMPLPINVRWEPYAHKKGNTTTIGYASGDEFLLNKSTINSERFTGIHSRIVYIDTAIYD